MKYFLILVLCISSTTFAKTNLANCYDLNFNIEGSELEKVKLYLSGKGEKGAYWPTKGILAASIGDIEFIKNNDSPEIRFDALYIALSAKPELYNEIISLFTNINERSKDGLSPLMIAVNCGKIEIVKELIAKGADINLKVKPKIVNCDRVEDSNSKAEPHYWNILTLGIMTKNTELVNLLLMEGASCSDVILSNGLTTLDIAKKMSTNEIVGLIEQCLSKK
ncbi:hypothetical protein CMT41_16790 [Colwellia sp. MT41]|uniref:ankyrin repeat domain-containing protein n=1 Tax=Colwellia sp. MT41 TaxID=58049 RepID=UPI0007175809|nr:ankyrin repeat domain-containing protein [Colwellia sp. MT41]ALO36202.1 hypothetical protein CMT41_16790 [Colwellia sp. MT41]